MTTTLLLGALFGTGAAVAGFVLTRRPLAGRKRSLTWEPAGAAQETGARHEPTGAGMKRRCAGAGKRNHVQEATALLYGSAAALSSSVLADSAMEHYRGGFYNRLMFVAPVASGLTLTESAVRLTSARRTAMGDVIYGAAAITGLIGSGFHTWNISKREGGWRWLNLFYGAPLAAPMGLVFAGLLGLAAGRLESSPDGSTPGYGGKPGELLALVAATGLAGTAAEAGLLHFRGAFHDPYMFLPVTVPPLAAAALLTATLAPQPATVRAARLMLAVTRLLGFAGVGFHAFGVQRNMGGWRNWSQNLLQGPPLPAPPSFTGMALAGEAALELQKFARGDR